MSRGYTIVEVMMSLSILGIGAAGVVALQKATLIGNTNARNVATANAIAASWAERLRAEAIQWNAPNGVDDLATETQWLGRAVTDPKITDWFNPAEIVNKSSSPKGPSGSPDADILGGDIFGNSAPSAFCTKMRLTRLLIFPNPSVNDPASSRTIRAEIRVYWDRAGAPVNCLPGAPMPDPETGDLPRFGFVTITTAVVQNTAP